MTSCYHASARRTGTWPASRGVQLCPVYGPAGGDSGPRYGVHTGFVDHQMGQRGDIVCRSRVHTGSLTTKWGQRGASGCRLVTPSRLWAGLDTETHREAADAPRSPPRRPGTTDTPAPQPPALTPLAPHPAPPARRPGTHPLRPALPAAGTHLLSRHSPAQPALARSGPHPPAARAWRSPVGQAKPKGCPRR